MPKRYPTRDPKPGSVDFELTRRRVANILRRIFWVARRDQPKKAAQRGEGQA